MTFHCISQPLLHMCSSSSFCTNPIIRWPFKSVQQNKSSPTEVSFPWFSKILSPATQQHMQHTIPTQLIAAEWPKSLNHVRSSWGIKCCCSHDFRSMVDNPIITAFALNMHLKLTSQRIMSQLLRSTVARFQLNPNKQQDQQAAQASGVFMSPPWISSIMLRPVSIQNDVPHRWTITPFLTDKTTTPWTFSKARRGRRNHKLLQRYYLRIYCSNGNVGFCWY